MSDLISREAVRMGRIPYDEDLTEYQRGWNDACDAIADNAPPAEPEQFNPCTVCQEFDCTGCKFRRAE